MEQIKIATREAYGNALAELAEQILNLVVLDADLSKSTYTNKFEKKFPERFINVGIAEANLAATAAGLAACGKVPFMSTFAVFASGRAYDQIRNSIAYPGLNVKIGATHAGITVGEDGGSHQSIEDIALMRAVPGMVVLSPVDGNETKEAVKAAINHKGPVYLRLGRLAVPQITDQIDDYKFEIGKSVQLADGKDIAIIATGLMVHEALKARDLLEKEGISARIINMHTIKPIDQQAVINCAEQIGKIVTAEEHSIIGGLGEAVAGVTAKHYPCKIAMVGIQDTFGRSGKPADLMKAYGLTAEDIVKAVRGLGGTQ
jgi:transketolase